MSPIERLDGLVVLLTGLGLLHEAKRLCAEVGAQLDDVPGDCMRQNAVRARHAIWVLLAGAGLTGAHIARATGHDQSTVNYEIKGARTRNRHDRAIRFVEQARQAARVC